MGYYDSKEGIFYPNSNYQYKSYNPKSNERTYLGLLERSSNIYKQGGILKRVESGKSGIHIKPENRGKFTALKKRTGKSSTWYKEHGTPAQKKMAVFALNAKKWKHK